MPLELEIDHLALGEAIDAPWRYLYLLDRGRGELVGVAGYLAERRYFECVDLVSDGYGPTLFLLLMQKARREGFLGVSPDLTSNTDEAKQMDARLYYEPPPGVHCMRNPDASHAEIYLNQIYFLERDLIAEDAARRNAEGLAVSVEALDHYLLPAQPGG